MRVIQKVEDIDYMETKQFFKNRADKFKEDNPYAVTMYQDDHPELVRERNKKEIEKLKPMLAVDQDTKLLDVACGIGRWADAITENIKEYCGVDFSGELIKIANERNNRENFYFYEGAATDIASVLSEHKKGTYNTVLLIGILMYVNDKDLDGFLEQLEHVCDQHAKICIREPIGLQDRLTLKDFYSNELDDEYHAIYRTRDELMKFLNVGLIKKGFHIEKEGFLFEEDALNNRKETAQYFFILER
uniref:Methyltransferase domain-containing protein n=1 Tax=Eubacterium plexicaudatum ASF492 TaxID=1235802 RepID=N2AZY6_9FIRM